MSHIVLLVNTSQIKGKHNDTALGDEAGWCNDRRGNPRGTGPAGTRLHPKTRLWSWHCAAGDTGWPGKTGCSTKDWVLVS